MNRFFGEDVWPAHLYPLIATPVGATCFYCDEKIAAEDAGVVFIPGLPTDAPMNTEHRECFLRGISGSADHQTRGPHPVGTCIDVPPGMTKRQAARAAVAVWEDRMQRGLPPVICT